MWYKQAVQENTETVREEKPDGKVVCQTETEVENRYRDWKIIFQSLPGFKPVTTVSIGEHTTPTPPPLPLIKLKHP